MSEANAAFDILVLGDFLAGRTGRVQTIHKEDLDAWFRSSAPSAGGLRFESYRDLRPESIAERHRDTASLLELCAALQDATKGKRTAQEVLAMLAGWSGPPSLADAVRKALDTSGEEPAGPTTAPTRAPEPTPTVRPADDDSLAAIFAQVDLGKSAEPSPSSALEGLLGGILGSGARGTPRASIDASLQAVEAELAARVRSLMSDPAFRALESCWLGLRFLSRRIDHRAGVRLHTLPATEADLPRALREIALPFVEDARGEGRTFVLLADFDLDLETARAVARELEAAAVPMIASVEPGALDLDSREAMFVSADLAETGGAAKEWNALRAEPSARWLALGVNRVLARAPYGAKGDALKAFAFEEPLDDLPWMRPLWAIGERIAASAVRTGWCLDCVGAGEGGSIADLPLRPLISRSGDEIACALEALISEQRLLELSRLGLVPLATRRNDDKAFIATAPLLFAPARGSDDRVNQIDARRATLPYQLMVTQIMTLVRQIYPHLDPNAGTFDLASTLAGGLKLLTLSATGPLFDIAVTAPTANEADAKTMALRLTPLRDPMRGLPDFELELPVPGRR